MRGAREQDSNAQGRELTTDDALELRRQGLSVHEIALVLYGSDDQAVVAHVHALLGTGPDRFQKDGKGQIAH